MLGTGDSVYNVVPFPGGFSDTGHQQWYGAKGMSKCEMSIKIPGRKMNWRLGGVQVCDMQLGKESVRFSYYYFCGPIFFSPKGL